MNNMLTEYVLKHSKRRDKELKYDFMPSLLEIIERPAHKAGTVIIVGIFTLLIAVIIWACVSEIDVVMYPPTHPTSENKSPPPKTAEGQNSPEAGMGNITKPCR